MTTSFDPVEASDLTKIAVHVFRQVVEDYVHLQHPLTRVKKYIHEAFLSAVDMFWDPQYEMSSFLNDEGKPMNLEEFLMLAADRSNLNKDALIKYLQKESESYWKNKHMNTIDIPEIMMVCNVPYNVCQRDSDTFEVDYDNRILYVNKTMTDQNNVQFCAALLEIICFHQDLKISKAARQEIGTKLYDTLKINNSFKEPKTQDRQVLPLEQS